MELNLNSDIKRYKFGTVFTQTRATYDEIRKQNSNFHKGLELWAKSINDFGNFERHFPCATSPKILAAMYARVPQAMAQICSKNRKIVPYHGANPNTRNGARLRSPSLIMAPDKTLKVLSGRRHHIFKANNIHDMTRIRIRRLCSIVLFISYRWCIGL